MARVVITGVGVVSAAVTGDSAALGAFLAAPFAPAAGALGAGAVAALVDPGESRRLSRVCQLTIAAARLALRESGLDPAAGLGLVVGTEFGDLASTHAFADGFLARVFGEGGLLVSSSKSMIGHTMAAAGSLEAIATVLALGHDLVPPTANLATPDPDVPFDCVPRTARATRLRCAISNSFGFGGQNVTLLFRRSVV